MISYFVNLLKNLKQKRDYNIVEEYKNSKFSIDNIKKLEQFLDKDMSEKKDGFYVQNLLNRIEVKWIYNGKDKEIKEISSEQYSVVIGMKTFILKFLSSPIKDIRFNIRDGKIIKINFVKTFFINFVDFAAGKVSLGLKGVKIKELFHKQKLSELTKDEWDLLCLNSNY